MKILSCNLNGIRSSSKKGFWNWINSQNFDYLCLQEIRASIEDIPEEAKNNNYKIFYNIAEKKGYSGVALYSKKEPLDVDTTFPFLSNEGRFVKCSFDRFNLISIYVPSGTSGQERQNLKYEFLSYLIEEFNKFKTEKKPYIICGDFNIAHKKIDLKNWKSNENTSGFLPEERAWMDKVFDTTGLVDAFRVKNQQEGQYTWWSARFKSAWLNNAGWRIDYQLVSESIKDRIKEVSIYKDQRFSDHAPVIIDYDL